MKDISFDWIGDNYYTRIVVNEKGQPVDGYGMFCKPNSFSLDNNPCSDYGWEVYPEGLKYVLQDVKKFDKPIIVTENGIADSKDFLRPSFLISHVEAIKESKVNVEAYLYWSLIDNFEWNFGYQMKFGIYTLDLKARPSAYIFKELTSFV
ncbi:family 1 glycosylhydrolase [Sulfurisphaera ohwakuensis]|uniref:family 1 glycosylhydrolase n=1 Tax=Sulfurisphaera ohwakuensis TaxID=69656 RepID=UPI0036F28635